MTTSPISTPVEALRVHGVAASLALDGPLPGGLINSTWSVGRPPRYVLQRVNAIFPAQVHPRIHEVTTHLRQKGLRTPRIVASRQGALVLPGPQGTVWRLMTWVDGLTHERLAEPRMAQRAGALVGRFHEAMQDFAGDLTPLRSDPHDSLAHMKLLERALGQCEDHRLRAELEEVGGEILGAWERWTASDGDSDLAPRPAHGDLKVSNLRFDEQGEAVCLIDLDTLSSMPLALELGDALRSWCNRAGEDVAAQLDAEIFSAAIAGYLGAARFVTPQERAALVPGMQRICVELAARFCADAFFERYFGWDPRCASGRGEHNMLRARGQLALGLQVEARRAELERSIGGCAT